MIARNGKTSGLMGSGNVVQLVGGLPWPELGYMGATLRLGVSNYDPTSAQCSSMEVFSVSEVGTL